jgi:F-type H+-transporting ATPase subunit b
LQFIWTSTVITMIAFAVLYFLLHKYAFGPLLGVMEKRRLLVQEQMTTAESNRLQSVQLLEEQKEALQQARKEAHDVIEQAKKTGSNQAVELVQSAKEESLRLKSEALKDIEIEKNKAIIALKSQVSGLSVLIASKIIEKQVDEQSQKELVDQYLDNVGNKS